MNARASDSDSKKIPSAIEHNHMVLAIILYDCILDLHQEQRKPWPFPEDPYPDLWFNRAAKDTRELILARRCLSKLTEADKVDLKACEKVRNRVIEILAPYDIILCESSLSSPVLGLKLPQGLVNDPSGKFWLIPR